MRKILELIVIPIARAVIRKYNPLIVAVAGTVGKTSTKNAIAAALGKTRRARPSEKNNNTELGAAVTAIGVSSPGRSASGWLGVLLSGLKVWLGRDENYPEILILEFGEQHPGDVARLAKLFPPKIGVVTAIGATHAEMLGGYEGVIAEMSALLQALPQDGAAILSADDERVLALGNKTKARVVRYGFADGANIRGLDPHPSIRRDDKRGLYVDGMNFKIEFQGNVVPAEIPGALGRPPVAAALAAIAVGQALGASALALIEGLRDYQPQKGRLRVVDGIKYATLIDDTYNASTKSMIEALRALRSIPLDEGEERIAVLGDMREMGALSAAEHGEVGAAVKEFEVDRLVTVGEMSRDINRAARAAGFPEERAAHFATAEEAGKFVQGVMERGDLVLVKGSRGTHLEAIVKELMADPLRAEELLEFGEPNT